MKIGLQIPDFTTPDGPPRLGADLATVARTADEGGFEFIAVMDHFFQIRGVGPVEDAMLEAYTTLGYLAAHTSRAKLVTLVTGAVYRYPGILAKNDSPDIPFNYSLNPYRGCEHGCVYCYARPYHEYLGFSAGLDFETKIMVKADAAALLRKQLLLIL